MVYHKLSESEVDALRTLRGRIEAWVLDAHGRGDGAMEWACKFVLGELEQRVRRATQGPARAKVSAREDERVKAYAETGSDAEAARRLGLSKLGFANWRRERRLPAKQSSRAGVGKRAVEALLKDAGTRERVEAAVVAHASDGDAAKDLGVSAAEFTRMRKALGVYRRRGPSGADTDTQQRVDALARVERGEWTAQQAAASVGLTVSGFIVWRRAHDARMGKALPKKDKRRGPRVWAGAGASAAVGALKRARAALERGDESEARTWLESIVKEQGVIPEDEPERKDSWGKDIIKEALDD